jgi:hypothetical protein
MVNSTTINPVLQAEAKVILAPISHLLKLISVGVLLSFYLLPAPFCSFLHANCPCLLIIKLGLQNSPLVAWHTCDPCSLFSSAPTSLPSGLLHQLIPVPLSLRTLYPCLCLCCFCCMRCLSLPCSLVNCFSFWKIYLLLKGFLTPKTRKEYYLSVATTYSTSIIEYIIS